MNDVTSALLLAPPLAIIAFLMAAIVFAFAALSAAQHLWYISRPTNTEEKRLVWLSVVTPARWRAKFEAEQREGRG